MKTITLVTSPVKTAVTITEAKKQLYITHAVDDYLIERYIYAATAFIEQDIQQKLVQQTWKGFLQNWQNFKVRFGKLQSITHIKYTDIDGNQLTLSSSAYDVDTQRVPGQVTLAYGQSWPTATLALVNPVEVQFITGLSVDSSISRPLKTGSGLDDVTTSGIYSGFLITDYEVQIDTVAATDKFRWRKDGGAWTSNVSITGAAQELDSNVSVTFAAVTGHTLNDKWDIRAGSAIPENIKAAILLLVGDMYLNRENSIEKQLYALPTCARTLLTGSHVWEWIV